MIELAYSWDMCAFPVAIRLKKLRAWRPEGHRWIYKGSTAIVFSILCFHLKFYLVKDGRRLLFPKQQLQEG